MAIPRFKFDIDENDSVSGVKVISLVDEPAIESDFVFFNKQKPKTFIELKKEGYKQVVAGLALRPDFDILRIDDQGNEYFGYFTSEGIEKIRNKFHKEQMTASVNTDHSSTNYIDAYLIESFIVDSEERLQDIKSRGIDEVTLGSWFVAYKIEDAETFKRVLEGELKGFSVEIFLQKFNRINNNYINEDKEVKDLIDKFKALFAELESQVKPSETKKFERAKSGDTIVEYTVVGEAVNIITVAEDGTETSQLAADGEYVLDNGKTVTVASGVATDIKDTEQPVEQEKAKEEEKLSTSVYASYTLEDGSSANVNVSSVNEVYIWNGEKSMLADSGRYNIKDGGVLVVEDGKYMGVENAPESKAFDEKKELAKVKAHFSKTLKEKDSLSREIEALKAEVEKLKKAPLANPTVKVDEPKEEIDLSKLSNADKLRLKYKNNN